MTHHGKVVLNPRIAHKFKTHDKQNILVSILHVSFYDIINSKLGKQGVLKQYSFESIFVNLYEQTFGVCMHIAHIMLNFYFQVIHEKPFWTLNFDGIRYT